MKIYHTATQEDYNALMKELSAQGCRWLYGEKMEDFDAFSDEKFLTCIKVNGSIVEYGNLYFLKHSFPNVEIIEYKPGKELKDLNESVLEIIENLAQATNFKSLYSLQKAKHNLDGLIEKWEVENEI